MTDQPTKETFIMIYNELISEKSKYHLTEKELYLLCVIIKMRNVNMETFFTVSWANELLKLKFNARKDRNLKEIKETLLSLKEKDVIHLFNHDGEIPETLASHDGVFIKEKELNGNGFTMIPISVFNSFNSITDFYIYVSVARWEALGSFNCDYDRWSRILDCSRPTTIKRINEAVKRKIIYVNVGDYLDELEDGREQKRQSKNAYRITPFGEEQKTIMTKRKEREILSSIPDETEEEIDPEIEYGLSAFETYEGVYGDSVYPDRHDYYLYMQVVTEILNKERLPTNHDKEFVATARKRMRQMKHNPQFIEDWNACLDEFQGEYKKPFVDKPY